MTWIFISVTLGVVAFLLISHFMLERSNTDSILYFFLGAFFTVATMVSEVLRLIWTTVF